jgi:FSR family fosmidomycin resistance protein-like MFS transporter
VLVLAGGISFCLSLFLLAFSGNVIFLLIALILFNPSSGAFVNLSQASLMDSDGARHEQLMARWGFAGSLGLVLGPFALGLAIALGFGWREAVLGAAIISVLVLLIASRIPFDSVSQAAGAFDEKLSIKGIVSIAANAVRRRTVIRWLVLLEFSDLMLDVLHGFLALYLVDVAGVSIVQAATAVGVWTGVGLLGDFMLIPLLERVRGLTYLRYSALAVLILFPTFLLAPGFGLKLVILGLLGLANAGWYSVLKGQLYTSMPGRSGTVMAVSSVSGLFGSLIPFALGAAAGLWGLNFTMWLLLAGPIALFLGIPRISSRRTID